LRRFTPKNLKKADTPLLSPLRGENPLRVPEGAGGLGDERGRRVEFHIYLIFRMGSKGVLALGKNPLCVTH
jgi:hypothetical protein